MFCLPADSDVDTPMSRVAEPQTLHLERSGTRPVGFTALSVPAGEQVSTGGHAVDDARNRSRTS